MVIREEEIQQTLRSIPTPGKKLLEPLKSLAEKHRLPLKILEDKEVVTEAEVHMNHGDLWYCLEGEVKFIYGGELVDPVVKKNSDSSLDHNELRAKEIRGGKGVVLKPGDWFWVPAGQPHQHGSDGLCRLVIIKIPKARI